MKFFLVAILSIICLNSFAQKPTSPVKILKTSIYGPDGKLWPVNAVKMDTVKIGVKLDIRYFASHSRFNIPLPDSFVNTKYKSEKIVIPYGEQNDKKYHYSTYCIYDSLSRVSNYGKSTCMVCSFRPYEYNVHYNSAGLVDEIVGAPHTSSQNELIKLYYDTNGDIKQLDFYEFDRLSTQVLLM